MTIKEAIEDRKQCLAYLEENKKRVKASSLEAVRMSVEALERADKYRWHKTYEELPEKDRYIIATDGDDIFAGITVERQDGICIRMLLFHKNDYYRFNEEYIYNSGLLKWKYIDFEPMVYEI